MTGAPEMRTPGPRANAGDRAEGNHNVVPSIPTASENQAPEARWTVAWPLAADGLATASRLIAVNGLLAESAAMRGDMGEAFSRLKACNAALSEAREIVAAAGRIAQ
ncbi:hypothetical protein [uncultured Rhodoblastus sp.]|uniref:hypothetical protein n=1 Tax=uncultured Rhodoblastus sp. TaxID=543037 RepID=UPI0025E4C442|nr:hypothetical protein [uncultured Rhodoblastus sp.]